jgi:uncharacterized membrane protein
MSAPAGPTPSPAGFSGAFRWAGYLLGFGLGGFFDGILLHQILQWHHQLSLVEGAAFQDLRVQVMADGIFHAVMYVIAAAGLWLLWRSRNEFGWAGAGRLLFAHTLIGFGVWHIVDGILSHWILGIHRIRLDAENVLFWDLLWFFAFGVLFVLAGWLLRRNLGPGEGPGGGRRPVAPAMLVAATLVAGPVAALPPVGVSSVTVLFRPATTMEQVLAAAAALDARLVWSDATGEIWVLDLPEPGHAWRLYGHGALLVGGAGLPAGCFAWSKPGFEP